MSANFSSVSIHGLIGVVSYFIFLDGSGRSSGGSSRDIFTCEDLILIKVASSSAKSDSLSVSRALCCAISSSDS